MDNQKYAFELKNGDMFLHEGKQWTVINTQDLASRDDYAGLEPVVLIECVDENDNLKRFKFDEYDQFNVLGNIEETVHMDDGALHKMLQQIAFYDALDALEKTAGFKKEAASKYDHIDFKPPKSVADAAARGLEYRKRNKGRGGLSTQQAKKEGVGSGVARAVSLKNRQTLSPATVKRMKAFFSRHEKNFKVEKGKAPWQDRGKISLLLWGGYPGRSWANKIVRQMEAADRKAKRKKK